MSNTVFDKDISTMLEWASKLMTIGDHDSSLQLCIKCVEKKARYSDGTDVIKFFYGANIYSEVVDIKSAMRYIFLATLCMKLYELVIAGNDVAKSNEIDEVFKWLKRTRRTYLDSDNLKLKYLYRSLNDPRQCGYAPRNRTIFAMISQIVR